MTDVDQNGHQPEAQSVFSLCRVKPVFSLRPHWGWRASEDESMKMDKVMETEKGSPILVPRG